MSKFAVKPWLDYHRVPTLFLVVDEDDCELGRFPSEAEAAQDVLAERDDHHAERELRDPYLKAAPACSRTAMRANSKQPKANHHGSEATS
jgi:hypothetical protein